TAEKDKNIILNGDKHAIKRIFINLLSNAVKFTEDNGEITVNSFKQKNTAIIEVMDNGIGISQKDVKRIFDRFYKVEEARNKDTGGSGLGLALVKKIVDMHNGKIDVSSELGKGTKIRICIPLRD
ncbi:MAG: ATP-binding protein, partial [Clostridia bacterium]|nr:ATP-binding protein [Clostridia bacterium]